MERFILLFLLLSACNVEPGERAKTGNAAEQEARNVEQSGMVIMTDPVTHCQYLASGHGLTPRLNNAGQPMCPEAPVRSLP